MVSPNFDGIWRRVEGQFRLGTDSLHGPEHWRRVEEFGLAVAATSGADPRVVRLFAVFHDACRWSESCDPGHGARGAALAQKWRGQGTPLDDLDEAAFTLLVQACQGHTDGDISLDPTVGTCWDADRLDLPRALIWPDLTYLSTQGAREIVLDGTYTWRHHRSRCP